MTIKEKVEKVRKEIQKIVGVRVDLTEVKTRRMDDVRVISVRYRWTLGDFAHDAAFAMARGKTWSPFDARKIAREAVQGAIQYDADYIESKLYWYREELEGRSA